MDINEVHLICFSPTRTSKQVGEAIVRGTGLTNIITTDLTLQAAEVDVAEDALTVQDESPKSELISGFTAGEDLFFCQPVAVYVCVPASNPAVIAVISAVVCKFNESPDIDIMSVELNPRAS